jgi:hypothetical protein
MAPRFEVGTTVYWPYDVASLLGETVSSGFSPANRAGPASATALPDR